MSIVETAREVLDVDELSRIAGFKIERIEVEDHIAWSGEPALRVRLIIAEDATERQIIDGERVSDLKRAIYDVLLAQDIEEFPYIFLAKQSELDQITDEQEHDSSE